MSRHGSRLREKTAVFPATLDAMETFLRDLRLHGEWFRKEADSFAAELLLREVLVNAVDHGSQCAPGRSVRCAVRLDRTRLTITVEDEGAGFDWRAVSLHRSECLDPSGRGFDILRAYSTGFRFNGKGNAVTVWKQFGMEEGE